MTASDPQTDHARLVTDLTTLFSLYLGALSLSLSAAGLTIAFFLIVIASLFNFSRIFSTIRGNAIFWLLLALIIYTTASQFIPRGVPPGSWHDATEHIIKASLLFLTGYWFYRHAKKISQFLTVYTVGFIIRSLIDFPWSRFQAAASGHYLVNLGFDHIECGELAGLAALIFIFVTANQPWWRKTRWSTVWMGMSWLAAIWSFFILILSRSRSAWVATVVTTIFILASYTIHTIRKKAISKRTILVSLVLGVSLSSVTLLYALNIRNRIAPVATSLHHFQHEGLAGVNKNSSSGMRINLYVYGLEKWKEKPFFGWGNSTSETLINRGGINQNVSPGNRSNSFLDTPIQLLVELGLVGVALFAAVIVVMTRGLVRAASRGTVERRVAYMLLGILLYKLVFNLFDVTYVYMLDTALILVFGGMAFGVCLANRDLPDSTAS